MAAISATVLQLRDRTADAHQRVEDLTDLLDPALTLDRLTAVLVRFHAFWAGMERLVPAWAAAAGPLAAELDWNARQRLPHLATDLDALGVAPAHPAPAPFAELDDAAALGWFYVSEGSTLGGAVLRRRLTPLLDDAGVTLSSFTPYPEGPGPRWLRLGKLLDTWTAGDPARTGAVCDAAEEIFGALERQLRPLRAEAAA